MRAILAAITICAGTALASAQTTVPKGDGHPGAACPPGTMQNAPTVGRPEGKPLSDQLAESNGVICPPAGVDPAMRQPTPEGGAMTVIPPPGSPGGDTSVQPK
jgi:hypothetical protein